MTGRPQMHSDIKKKKVLFRTRIPVTIHLEPEDIREGMNLINEYYCGDRDCNEIKDGVLVSKYPLIEKLHPEWVQAHYAINRSQMTSVEVEVYSNGSFKIVT